MIPISASPARKGPAAGTVWKHGCLLLAGPVRPVVTLALTLGLLAPFVYGFIPLLVNAGTSCATSCCKKPARCCHRSGSRESHTDSRWTAASSCGKSCGQQAALPAPLIATLALNWFGSGPAADETTLRCDRRPLGVRAGTEFALYGRPPPPC